MAHQVKANLLKNNIKKFDSIKMNFLALLLVTQIPFGQKLEIPSEVIAAHIALRSAQIVAP